MAYAQRSCWPNLAIWATDMNLRNGNRSRSKRDAAKIDATVFGHFSYDLAGFRRRPWSFKVSTPPVTTFLDQIVNVVRPDPDVQTLTARRELAAPVGSVFQPCDP